MVTQDRKAQAGFFEQSKVKTGFACYDVISFYRTTPITVRRWKPRENTSKLYSWTTTMWQGGHVGGQYNRIFFRRIYMTTEFSSQRSKMLLFLTTNMPASRDVTCEPAIERFHDVTMAILVSQNNETVAMLVFQISPHSCGSWTFFLCKNLLLFR